MLTVPCPSLIDNAMEYSPKAVVAMPRPDPAMEIDLANQESCVVRLGLNNACSGGGRGSKPSVPRAGAGASANAGNADIATKSIVSTNAVLLNTEALETLRCVGPAVVLID